MKNKELTPLEALEDLISFIGSGFVADTHELCEYVAKRKDIIKKALNRLERLEKSFKQVTDMKCNMERIINRDSKKLKALEIIKQKVVNVKDFIFYLSLVDQLGEENIIDLCCGCSKTPLTKEEYDLLKEVLK